MEVIYKGNALWYKDDRGEVGNSVIIKQFFELIEEDTIDIDSIEELENRSDEYFEMLLNDSKLNWLNKYQQEDKEKINKLVQAVKQLNKEIKELKEK